MPRVTKGGLHQVCVYLTASEHGKLRAAAQDNGRTLASETRVRLVPGLSSAQGAAKAR